METQSTILDQDLSFNNPVRRRSLLPWWMKVFSWLFMATGILVPCVVVAGMFGFEPQLSLYGFETSDPFSTTGILISLGFLLKGIVGYGLFFEKDWAITLGMIDAVIGIIVCVAVMVVLPIFGGGGFNFRLEIFFVGLFLWKLVDLRRRWF